MGTVDFNQMLIIQDSHAQQNPVAPIQIKRKQLNRKVRPQASNRQSNSILIRKGRNQMELRDDQKDLEWLSWNWRTTQLQKLFKTKK